MLVQYLICTVVLGKCIDQVAKFPGPSHRLTVSTKLNYLVRYLNRVFLELEA